MNSFSESFFFQSRDGLRLHGQDYRGDDPALLPAVCLPGLTRTVRDFHALALRLQSDGRRVIAFDLRGRGQSDRDPTAKSYLPVVEAQDVLDGMTARGIARAVFIGTSRGGIVTMLAGLLAPGLVATAVLNDIGAVIELGGLLRIKGYVGRTLPEGIDWPTLITVVSQANRDEFPRLDAAAWERHARRLFRDVEGRPAMDYDPEIARTLDAVTAETPMPDLWAAFDTLAEIPILSVRGALSDLLTEATVAEMAARAPRLETLVVADQGHAPLFDDDVSLDGLVAFLDRAGA